jgi:uncharacterized protein YqgV (UPF0045/DUF77 family)
MIAAQVSLYPLGRDDLGPPIRNAISTISRHDLSVRPGEMSTVISGREAVVFEALLDAFSEAAANGAVVMTVTVSNACPLPASPGATKEE